jgi:feruloyl esterase
MNDTLNWYREMNEQMGEQAAEFAKLYLVPGMGHCRGGPATDRFEMLSHLMAWVEEGTAPEGVYAEASNPGYFGVEARSRLLCPFPLQAKYDGTGDINAAQNFSCSE